MIRPLFLVYNEDCCAIKQVDGLFPETYNKLVILGALNECRITRKKMD